MRTMRNYQITRNKFLDRDERTRLLENTKKMSLQDIRKGNTTWPKRLMLVNLAIYSGLRVSEIAMLRVEDVKLDTDNPSLFVRNGKGDKSRDVYIDLTLAAEIRDFIKQNELTGPLLANKQGGHYTSTALYLSFRRARRAAGLREGLSVHSARHTYATFLLDKSGDLRAVQKALGHSSLSMTILYADVLPERASAVAAMIRD